ncbi:MAG: DUF928 domain-containing protein [Nostocales cyanobacterium ELA583]
MAQKSSVYNENMLRGYQFTRQRNYKKALGYFQKALEIRPNDQYATTAIRNVSNYIARRSSGIIFASGNPRRTSSAASRGSSLVALTPSDKDVQFTTAEHPTFFFSIPESGKETIREFKFILQQADAQTTKPIYETTFTPTPVGKKGILSISIPRDKAPLKTGKEYTWTFSMSYPLEPDVFPKSINGKIERVQDEFIADQIQQTTKPLDQVRLYTISGFWENSLSILANLRRQNPNDPDVQQSWTELLKSVNLEAIANEPLL